MHIRYRETFAASWSALEKRLLPSYVWTSDPLTFWRERILFLVCFITTAFGPIALVPSLLLAYREGLWGVILIDSLAYMGAVTTLIARKTSFVVRALALCVILYVLGIYLLFILGPGGAGYIWLFGASVLISTFIGLGAAIWTLALNTIALLSVGIFIAYGHPVWILNVDNALKKWLVMSANFLLLNAFVTITTAFLLNGLKTALLREQKISKDLRESEELFRSYLEQAPDGIYLSDLEGTFLYGNRKSEEIIGYRKEEMVGKNFLELNILSENSLDKAVQLLQANIEGRPTGPDEIELTNKEGRLIPVEISTSVVQRMGQRIVLAFVRDITERKQAEEVIQEEKYLSESIINSLPGIFYLFDAQGKFLRWNRNFEIISGYSPKEILDRHPADFFAATEKALLQQAIRDAFVNGEANVEAHFVSRNGLGTPFFFTGARIEINGQPHLVGMGVDITNRKKAEEELRKSESLLNCIIQSTADGILAVGGTGKVLLVNNRFAQLWHIPKDVVARGDDNELLHLVVDQLNDPEAFFAKVRELYISDISDLDTFVFKDGRIFERFSIPLISEGRIDGRVWSFRDITVRKQAEDDLRKSEERYRTILEDIDEGYYENDLAGNFTFVNDAECRDLGYSREELIGMNYRQCSDEATANNLYELFYNIYNTGKPVKRFPEQFISKDGTRHFNELSASLIRDEKGKPIGFRGVSQDITERKRAEEELRLSEERFKRIFDEGPIGMILVNPDYTIVTVNKVFCGLLGYNKQEIIGQKFIDLTCEEDKEKNRELSEKLFAGSIPVFRLEKRYVRKDGGIAWANVTASAIHGKEGKVIYSLSLIEDLTDSKKAAEKIHLLHYYDNLTGLPNRTFHKELIKRSIEHALRHKEKFAIIYIGLDNFQRINDTLGYSTGDLLLKAVADRLTNSLRKSDLVARSDEGETVNVVSRVGGDEFIILAHDLNQAQDAARTSRRLLEEISAPYDLSGREVFITVSIGIALYPDDGLEVDDLLKNAEKAMRYTKSEGKNNYHFYSTSMHASVLELLTLESDLHKALERNELVLYYQPKVDAATRMVKGMEALIRWKHPDRGLIPPMQFIPLAETSGLILPIGEFVIRTVCGQIKTWQEAGYHQMNIALNVSSRQFDQQSLKEIVVEALQEARIPPQCLELEITESTIMRNPEKAMRTLTELKAMGIGISIDDFGTGYSSLSYLKRLPLDILKIDQSFVKSLGSDPRDQAIVRAIVAMAHSLNLKTIAEGVETEEQLSLLREYGCDEIQGYLFSRPLPAEKIPGILAKGYL